MFSIREIFDLAMRIEENGEKFYRAALEEISSQPMKSLMEWLADQELATQDWGQAEREIRKDNLH